MDMVPSEGMSELGTPPLDPGPFENSRASVVGG